jgi:hypothetical protein
MLQDFIKSHSYPYNHKSRCKSWVYNHKNKQGNKIASLHLCSTFSLTLRCFSWIHVVGTEQDFFKSYSLHQNQKFIVQSGPPNHRKTNKKSKISLFPTFSLTLVGLFATREGGRSKISSNPTACIKIRNSYKKIRNS